MTEERKELLQRMSRAAYAYATEIKGATWSGKRRGLKFQHAQGVQVRSCGAFRAWEILAHDGSVGWCVDGYRQREYQKETGSVCVLIGDGKFIFPHDDSATNHSLSFAADNGAKLVWVTNEEGVPWEPHILAMAEELEAAVVRLREAIAAYDAEEVEQKELKRSAEVAAASQALASVT